MAIHGAVLGKRNSYLWLFMGLFWGRENPIYGDYGTVLRKRKSYLWLFVGLFWGRENPIYGYLWGCFGEEKIL